MKIPPLPSLLGTFVLLLGLAFAPAHAVDPFAVNQRLGGGVNLGNALDAPNEGEWGVTLKEEYFDAIKAAGFNSVRLPVRWSAHAAKEAPYTIDPAFFARVDWAVNQALKRGLMVILNLHHYREIYADPAPHKERYLGLWRQIAPHYQNYPDSLLLELFNEPDEALTPDLWNEWLVEALAIVRASNPDRTVVIGPGEDNIAAYLPDLRLPENDRNIIVTIHCYHPLNFTHQGAEWFSWIDARQWLGATWGTPAQRANLNAEFDVAAAWGRRHNRPVNLGEFGCIKTADPASRVAWTRAVAEAATARGMSYHYWEFCADWFGLYDQQAHAYRQPLLDAVLLKKD
jgi:endoglucanase